MADTFRNPYNYTSPIGAALADLTRTVISGPSRADRIKAAEEMLKVKRANESLLTAQSIIGQPDYDPNAFAAAALGAGISGGDLGDYGLFTQDPNATWDDPALNNAFIRAGGAPSSTAGAFFVGENNENTRHSNALAQQDEHFFIGEGNENTRAANTLGETVRFHDLSLSQDESQFGRTLAQDQSQFSTTFGETQRQFNEKPFAMIGPDGPVIGTQATAPGNAPIMSEADTKGYFLGDNWGDIGSLPPAEQTILGARGTGAPTPRNYVNPDNSISITYDGTTDAQTGTPLAPGGYIVAGEGAAGTDGLTTTVRGGLQNAQVGIDRAKKMLDYTESLVLKDPTNFGLTGTVKGLGQDVGQLAANIATGLGYDGLQNAIADIQKDAAANGVNPTVLQRIFTFDPTLGELQGAYGMLVYSLAGGIAGQEGRELSDADLVRAAQAFGDPSALFASQQSILSKLKAARVMLGINEGVVDNALNPGATPAAPAAPDPGTIMRVMDDTGYNLLPSGTEYIAPDGSIRVKK